MAYINKYKGYDLYPLIQKISRRNNRYHIKSIDEFEMLIEWQFIHRSSIKFKVINKSIVNDLYRIVRSMNNYGFVSRTLFWQLIQYFNLEISINELKLFEIKIIDDVSVYSRLIDNIIDSSYNEITMDQTINLIRNIKYPIGYNYSLDSKINVILSRLEALPNTQKIVEKMKLIEGISFNDLRNKMSVIEDDNK